MKRKKRLASNVGCVSDCEKNKWNVKIVTKRKNLLIGEIKNVESSESPCEFVRKAERI